MLYTPGPVGFRPHPAPPPPPPALMCPVSLQVPAGLHVDLQVQLLAVAARESEEPQTRVHHDLLIQTELEILHLPVTAQVLRPARDRLCPGL